MALVVTIVVLIILATVSINTVFNDDGIIKRAESTIKIQQMAEEKERLETVKGTVIIANKGKLPLDKYVEELIKQGIVVEDEITTNEDGSKDIITDNGYTVNIKQDGENNVIITVEGKADSLPVRIIDVQLTTSTSSIKVDVEVKRGEGATYRYYYKTEGTEYGEAVYEGKETSYTIEKLPQNVTYTIKVEAINKNGVVYKEVVGRTEEVQNAVGIIEYGELSWNNGQAEVTVTKNTEDSLKMEYQVLDEELNVVREYEEIENGGKITGLNLGETVQTRLTDGINYGNTASITVADTTVPNEASISLSSTTTDTETSITATVTQSDGESGVDITNCRWVYLATADKLGTDDTTKYPNTFTTTPETLTLEATTAGTYYLHVLTTDKAGNKVEKVSEAVTVKDAEPNYVGYYADIDGDTEPDGVIYADLAFSVSGLWYNSNGAFSYEAITETKDYYVSKTGYEGEFGTKDVLTAKGSGADRFYVMALDDFNEGTNYTWYDAAYDSGISDYATITSVDFGKGRENTETMIEKWNDSAYGAQNDNSSYADMWGAIQDEVEKGWFVPSKGEWGAFGSNLGITSSNYGSYGLSRYFWSSSLGNTNYAWYANFYNGYMINDNINNLNYVRLSATF